MFEVGRICMKTAGREAGRFCVIIGKDKEKGFVVVTGPKSVTKVRRRRCNLTHLEPTPFKIDIKENATDEEILEIFEKENIYEKLHIERISEIRKERHEKREEKIEKKEEKVAEIKEEIEEEKERKVKEHKEEKPKKMKKKEEGKTKHSAKKGEKKEKTKEK
jgi:large subunit ribosomal protein L14e